MARNNHLYWDEYSGPSSPSRFNTFLVNGTLIDPGIIGFDLNLPAFEKLIGRENLARVKRVILSHGHFDHWNHIQAFAQMPNAPIYMGALTQALILRSAEFEGDMELSELADKACIVDPGDIIEDEIETFILPHSIPQNMGLALPGKNGLFVHLGDFRLSGYVPEDREKAIAALKYICQQGVDTVALNIFNAHVPGQTPLEQLAVDEISRILAEAPGKVVITCFSTNLARISRICEEACKLGRPVRFFGSAMQYSSRILDLVNATNDWERAVYIVTGCQAEPGSALDVLAKEVDEGIVHFGQKHWLVYSSRCIPGNEDALRRNISTLSSCFGRVIVTRGDVAQIRLRGLDVDEAFTHVSGHAYRKDILEALEALRPRKAIPWPQTEPQFRAFKTIAEELGIEVLSDENRVIDI